MKTMSLKEIAENYNKYIENKYIHKLKFSDEETSHVYHLYVIRVKARNKLIKEMNKSNIYPGIHYVKAVHHQKLLILYM